MANPPANSGMEAGRGVGVRVPWPSSPAVVPKLKSTELIVVFAERPVRSIENVAV